MAGDTHARQLSQLVKDKGQSSNSGSLWEQEKTTFLLSTLLRLAH